MPQADRLGHHRCGNHYRRAMANGRVVWMDWLVIRATYSERHGAAKSRRVTPALDRRPHLSLKPPSSLFADARDVRCGLGRRTGSIIASGATEFDLKTIPLGVIVDLYSQTGM